MKKYWIQYGYQGLSDPEEFEAETAEEAEQEAFRLEMQEAENEIETKVSIEYPKGY